MTKTLERFIKNDLSKIVESVRHEIKEYNEADKDFDFNGFCDEASDSLIFKIKRYMDDTFGIQINAYRIHGEQKHTPKIPSIKWSLQHTWVAIVLSNNVIYVDATCQQFQDLYDDIPNYYISGKPPKWFYPDSKNWVYGVKFTRWINKKIKIKHSLMHEGIIEFIQYSVWGTISDLIRKVLYKNERID